MTLKITDLTPCAVARYQWLRNKEGGQSFGSQTLIVAIDEAVYGAYVRPKLRDDLQHTMPTLKEFRERWPGDTHGEFVSGEGRWTWRLVRVGPLHALRPRERSQPYALEVGAFDSMEAREWGRTADSDIYPLKETMSNCPRKAEETKHRKEDEVEATATKTSVSAGSLSLAFAFLRFVAVVDAKARWVPPRKGFLVVPNWAVVEHVMVESDGIQISLYQGREVLDRAPEFLKPGRPSYVRAKISDGRQLGQLYPVMLESFRRYLQRSAKRN